MQKTSSKTAIITGGNSGIGRAIANKFEKEQIQTFIADKNISAENSEGRKFKQCDITDAEDVDAFFSWTTSFLQAPDVLVLNAGQGISEKLAEGDPEKWQKVINTNLMGPLRFIRAFVPQMLEQKKGHVVFISSVASNNPHAYGGIYSATKTALEVVAETLRLETLPYINITVISPGITETDFFKNEISAEKNIEDMNMGSISPEEIAEDVFYAISKKSGTSINKIITRPIEQNF